MAWKTSGYTSFSDGVLLDYKAPKALYSEITDGGPSTIEVTTYERSDQHQIREYRGCTEAYAQTLVDTPPTGLPANFETLQINAYPIGGGGYNVRHELINLGTPSEA